jgi:predicted nucleotidyltransferase
MTATGLDSDGYIAREGALDRVPPAFAAVVAAAVAAIQDIFGGERPRLHSAYLYGSIPRGTAVPGVSDLDMLLVFHGEPTPADTAAIDRLNADLDARFPQISGAGLTAASVATILSELERHDLGWFVACLCTPVVGPDLGERLPRYRPTSLLARETNGDLVTFVPHWLARLDQADAGSTRAERIRLSRGICRRLVRSGFTLVMPRWGGWTSDLDLAAAVFGRYYPERAEQMRTAAAIARAPGEDLTQVRRLACGLGPWLAAEYLAVHGRKAPRG